MIFAGLQGQSPTVRCLDTCGCHCARISAVMDGHLDSVFLVSFCMSYGQAGCYLHGLRMCTGHNTGGCLENTHTHIHTITQLGLYFLWALLVLGTKSSLPLAFRCEQWCVNSKQYFHVGAKCPNSIIMPLATACVCVSKCQLQKGSVEQSDNTFMHKEMYPSKVTRFEIFERA